MKDDRYREQAFIEEVKKTLTQKGQKLDPETLIKLSTLSGGVIENRSSGFAGLWRLIRLPLMAALSAGLIIMFTLIFFRGPVALRNSFAGLEELEILAAEGGPDFYANLDFYAWLASRKTDESTKP